MICPILFPRPELNHIKKEGILPCIVDRVTPFGRMLDAIVDVVFTFLLLIFVSFFSPELIGIQFKKKDVLERTLKPVQATTRWR